MRKLTYLMRLKGNLLLKIPINTMPGPEGSRRSAPCSSSPLVSSEARRERLGNMGPRWFQSGKPGYAKIPSGLLAGLLMTN